METKKINSFNNDEKHEFYINITNNKNEIPDNINETYILVEHEKEIEKAYESIINSDKCQGLITVSSYDLYDKFYNSGLWNYTHIYSTDLDVVKNILYNINKRIKKDLYLVFWCNSSSNIFEINELLEILKDNSDKFNNWFSMPVVSKTKDKIYEIGVFYK